MYNVNIHLSIHIKSNIHVQCTNAFVLCMICLHTTAVFDKRDGFSFHILVNFPHMDSNIPSKPAYGVYISQLVRIGRICDSYGSFFTRHHQLTCRLVKQGFLYDKLVTTCTSFKGFCSRYPETFFKFGVSIRKHVEDGICLPTVAIRSLSNKVSSRSR